MKYIVGLPVGGDRFFLEEIVRSKDRIREVYFSFGDMPSGRSTLSRGEEGCAFERQKRQWEDLGLLASHGIALNLLFNANCYGRDSQSRAFFGQVGDTVDAIRRNFGLGTVTTSSPLIAKFIKANFEGIDLRASVNMEIGTPEGFSYVSHLFDSFYVKRECNRDLGALRTLRAYCDGAGKEMYLLANSGCLNFCSAHTFHDNLVAHEGEIARVDNGYGFDGICWEFLSGKENRERWLERTNFIRPEDLSLYEELVPAVKLATRVNMAPSRVLDAYVKERYRGNIMEILEPNHAGLFYPDYPENAAFPAEFGRRVMTCRKNCDECGYCRRTLGDVTVRLDGDFTVKARKRKK